MYDIRHAYLHFQIDPIMIKYGMDLRAESDRCWIWCRLRRSTMSIKNDFVLLADESLIKAVEAASTRIRPASSRRCGRVTF